jgi:putative transposase
MKRQHPHQSSLRKGRWSWPNHCYFITTNAAGHQPLFADARVAEILMESLCWLQDQGRIRLMGFVVMPDHLHMALVLNDTETDSGAEARSYNKDAKHGVGAPFRARSLAMVMDSFKGYTGKKINKLLRRRGPVWQRAYHDRLVRNRKDFETRLAYMQGNPVRKQLVRYEHEHAYSTANPKYADLIDWAWLDGMQSGRAQKGALTT